MKMQKKDVTYRREKHKRRSKKKEGGKEKSGQKREARCKGGTASSSKSSKVGENETSIFDVRNQAEKTKEKRRKVKKKEVGMTHQREKNCSVERMDAKGCLP